MVTLLQLGYFSVADQGSRNNIHIDHRVVNLNFIIRIIRWMPFGRSMMKGTLLVPLLLSLVTASLSEAAFYQWVDRQGVVHFTDDAKNIPLDYRKKARKLELSELPSSAVEVQPRQPTQPEPAAPKLSAPVDAAPGGHTQQWWRQRFAALRAELKALQSAMPLKQANLGELRRKRTIYQRGRDREAINVLQAQISADEVRIGELQNQLNALDLEASRAAVPMEWRR
jgi:hypothetical protein